MYILLGNGNACLLTANFTRKPAYYAISDMFHSYD